MNEILWHKRARKQLKKIPRPYQVAIVEAVDDLRAFPNSRNLDVKALKSYKYGYRLRVGRYRVLFDFDGTIKVIAVQEVKKRDEQTY